MSIIYSLVAKGNDAVLSEYTEFVGNFQQISRILMMKTRKKNVKFSIPYDSYKFYYHNEENLTYLCMTDNNMADETAFAFLLDVRNIFFKFYDPEKLSNLISYQLNEFNEQLKNLAVKN
jgi:hypothetical protein